MFDSVQRALKSEFKRQCEEGFCLDVVDGYSGFIWMNREGHVLSPHNLNRALERITRDYNDEEKVRAKKERRKPQFSVFIFFSSLERKRCEESTGTNAPGSRDCFSVFLCRNRDCLRRLFLIRFF